MHFSDKIIDLAKSNKFIYILLVNKNKEIFKIGRTKDIRKRLQSYATGKDKHPDIKFIMIVDDSKKIENCAKIFLKAKQFKANKELYHETLEILKKILFSCAGMDKMVKDDINNNKKYDTYVIFDDSESIETLDINGNVKSWERGYKTIKMPKHKTTQEQKDREKIIKEVNNTKKYSKLKQLKNATITSFKL